MNLIFDMNYFGMRTLHVARYLLPKEVFLDDEESQLMFLKKLAIDFLSEIRKFSDLNRVIITLDSHSWRKEIFQTYKINRAKSDKEIINWKNFYSLLDEFSNYMETKCGVYKTRINRSESDDNIFLWKKYLFNNKESLIAITTDKDMWQLLETNEDSIFGIYNNHSQVQTIYLKNKTSEFFSGSNSFKKTKNDVMDFMDSENMFKEFYKNPHEKIKDACDNFKIKCSEIDPKKNIFEKVFLGDNSDNIHIPFKSVEGSDLKITRRETNYLYGELIDGIYKDDEDITVSDILKMLNKKTYNILKNKMKLLDDSKYEETLELKKKLVILNEENIPEEIQNEFDQLEKFENTNISKLRDVTADDVTMAILGSTTDFDIYSRVY